MDNKYIQLIKETKRFEKERIDTSMGLIKELGKDIPFPSENIISQYRSRGVDRLDAVTNYVCDQAINNERLYHKQKGNKDVGHDQG
tara:strand:- start:2325 stop:2582 length:258 start_codon:yes stop_codon:yes gene_type:complete